MPNTYTWTTQAPGSLECVPSADGKTNIVSTVHWRLNGSDGTYDGTTCGAQPIALVPDDLFVPYDSLTEAQVVGWAQEAMGADAVTAAEAAVQAQIDLARNPPVVVLPLPWE